MESNTLVELKNITKCYGKQQVIDIPSLALENHKIYGLVGNNGAGKTTLFRLLTGIDFPTKGTIEYTNPDIRKAALIEQPAVEPSFNGYDNMKYMSILYGIKDESKIEELLRLVKLWDDRSKKVKNYSLGMKQRLGIAMALIGSPEFLLLDEPINGVDPNGVMEFREIIKKISDSGVTIIISSHILAELHKIATDYIFMEKGKIVKTLTTAEIEELQADKYIINTDANERACQLISEVLRLPVTVTAENKLLLRGSEDDLVKATDFLRENAVKIREQYLYQFDLEAYFKEEV